MLSLLRKDFIALKSSLWVVLLYLVVFSAAFIPKMELSIYFVGIYTAFGSIILVTMNDIKNSNHNFLVTLPISRRHIVLAKYMTTILFTFCGVLGSYVIHLLVKLAFPQLSKPDFGIIDILVSVGLLLVLISIYMPLFYAFSKKGAGVINTVFMVCMILLAQPAAILFDMLGKNDAARNQITFLILIGTLLLLAASYYLTRYLFTRKDL
ncbi:ABC-2 transporter permease [Neobacillus mesonae]|nr:ABC-2 transporter permease [Neobacillus mesonae]